VLAPFFFDNGGVSSKKSFRLATLQLFLVSILIVFPLLLLWLLRGLLQINLDEAVLNARHAYRVILVVVTAAVVVVVPFILFMVRRYIVIPLTSISERAQEFSGGTPILIREQFPVKEIDELAHAMNEMIETVMSREDSLQRMNDDLESKVKKRTKAHEDTIETLRSARDQLLLSEKMSALGSLVSGVAHEINTPLSIGVTAASFLNERTRNLYEEWDEQSLTQDNLERFLKDAEESSRIIQNNLDQAARILSSLKQVAVDQQLDERREFELSSYINDIILSLKYQLKGGKHSIQADSNGVIMVDSYPGAITQILNNLVFNSITHGFEGREDGRIRISYDEDDGDVVMNYRDNGRGLSEEEYQRIFDQFYTTRRGSGGTGLGMNIVLKLVSERLKGSIVVSQGHSEGAGFTIRFPQIVSEDSLEDGI
jgi:C4-dicarboxylate-specific signal transduction histidine kinase